MGDIQTQLPVKLTDNINTAAITAGSALKVDSSAVTQPISGTITLSSQTVTLSSQTVTAVQSGTYTVAPTGTQAVSYGSGTFTTQDAADGPVSPGAAAAKSILGGMVYNTAAPAPTNGQQLSLQSDSAGNLKVAGNLTTTPSGTQTVAYGAGTFPVSGTVTAVATGTYTTAPTGTQAVSYGSGTFTTQDAADGAGPAPGAAASKSILGGLVYNTAAPTPTNGQQLALQGDSSGNLKVALQGSSTVTTVPSGTQGVSVTNSPTVTIGATSVTQPVSGTVTLSSQTVTLSSQTVTAVQSGTYGVSVTNSPSVTTIPETSGTVTSYATVATVAAASTGTISYTVTTGKTLYWKGIMASSSGGPCKVTVDYGAGPTVVCVAFYSATSPFLNITFPQPLIISATTVVNVKIQNNAGAAQDIYATIFGAEH